MRRIYFQTILQNLDQKQFVIIAGPRQSGKTTTLKQIQKYLESKGEKSVYIDLENPQIRLDVNEHPEKLLSYTEFRTTSDSFRYFILLDEVQYAKDPSNLLKYLYDTYHPQLKIIATGSSSFYIDNKFSDSLVGRKRLITSSTLSFKEFLEFSKYSGMLKEYERLQRDPGSKSALRPALTNALDTYLTYGGYPEVVLAKDIAEKRAILEDIALSMVQKDLIESGRSDDLKYIQLLRLLAKENGGLLNLNSISIDLAIARPALEEMLYVAKKSLLVSVVSPFHKNFRKELSKMPKLYFLDIGLRNYFVNDFRSISNRQNNGQLLENYVYLELWRNFNSASIHYWRTADQYEVDFVIEEVPGQGKAFEVKYSGKRSFSKGQKRFMEHYQSYPLSKICFADIGGGDIDILNFSPDRSTSKPKKNAI